MIPHTAVASEDKVMDISAAGWAYLGGGPAVLGGPALLVGIVAGRRAEGLLLLGVGVGRILHQAGSKVRISCAAGLVLRLKTLDNNALAM